MNNSKTNQQLKKRNIITKVMLMKGMILSFPIASCIYIMILSLQLIDMSLFKDNI